MHFPELHALLLPAIALRRAADGASRVTIADPRHESAFRLFNGFSEGAPDLVIDVYGGTVLIQDYASEPAQNISLVPELVGYLRKELDWLRAGVHKVRSAASQQEKRGRVIFGAEPDTKINEHGVWYAIDLTMHRDASFYLDTRNLRKWLIENVRGKSVLNTFAYTGSFGIAALAGGASRVLQVDRNRKFLALSTASCALNGISADDMEISAQDFFPAVARLKSTGHFFDCVILDPPFFSTTAKGRVDQVNDNARLINKVRPLINDGGGLVAINNALYVSGSDYMRTLEGLCSDGYLTIETLIPVPEDFAGLHQIGKPITDPAPFNHSTKIAVLRVKRKGRDA